MHEILSDRSVLTITGEDRATFFQGITTKNCLNLAKNQLIYTLMLSPHGKYLFDFFLLNQEHSYLIDIASSLKDEFIEKIKLYKLRKKIEISHDNSRVVIVADKALENHHSFHHDPRNDNLGFRAMLDPSALPSLPDIFYHRKRIGLLIPEGCYDMVRNSAFPLEYGFDKINAIDFDKGCYIGQELIARTHFKGEIRKKVYLLSSDSPFPPLGTVILCKDKRIGLMASSCKNLGLALLRVEDVNNHEINSLIINNREYKILK